MEMTGHDSPRIYLFLALSEKKETWKCKL